MRDTVSLGYNTAGGLARSVGYGNRVAQLNGLNYGANSVGNNFARVARSGPRSWVNGARQAVGIGIVTAGLGTGAVADLMKLAGQTIAGTNNRQHERYRNDRAYRRDTYDYRPSTRYGRRRSGSIPLADVTSQLSVPVPNGIQVVRRRDTYYK